MRLVDIELGQEDALAVHRLGQERLGRAKRAFTTRRVPNEQIHGLLGAPARPLAGDLVLARVTRLGQHTGVQRPDGRRARLFVGDEIIVSYGARYAPNQFESAVPDDLGPCHLVAAGGIASRALSWHSRVKRATRIEPLGLVTDATGRVINLRQYRLPPPAPSSRRVPVIAVAGTAMDAGKTTAAADLIRGLRVAGLSVAAAKATGTGACGDYFAFVDAGARTVLDFTDLGFSTTCGLAVNTLERILEELLLHLKSSRPDAIVIEIADGLLQSESAALLRSACFERLVDGVLFCAPDALGAAGGVDWLERQGLQVCAVAGSLTAAPLAIDEARRATRLPVLTRSELVSPSQAVELIGSLFSGPSLQAAPVA